ncbi:MAG: HU family DNA-binding protein [Clostridiales bacterium]|nr:HU family DNA-binding protein [Clostridiales bacterium]
MTKTELIKAVAAETGLTNKDAAAALDAALGIISRTLAEEGKVQLTGFGTFLTKERAAHLGRNLSTGEPVEVPAHRVVQFKAGKLLKGMVNPGADAEEG